MANSEISRATLGRIPTYLNCLNGLPPEVKFVSATAVAKQLGLGEVQVRKDLGAVSGVGKPKVGYNVAELAESLERFLCGKICGAVIIGAGKLGRALIDYSGFADYGLEILAAFDKNIDEPAISATGKPILPLEKLAAFCSEHEVNIGIIAVPASAAQEACDLFIENSVKAMLCFAPCRIKKPDDAVIQYENMALSLAHLKMQIK